MRLASEFPEATRDQWRALVGGVLRKSGVDADSLGQPVEAALAGPTYDGFDLAPLYTADDPAPPAGYPGLPPHVRGGTPDGRVLDGWDVRQRHAHPDPDVSRRAILADLEHGATSLWLAVGAAGLPVDALGDVLADVHLDLAPVTLDAGADLARAAAALLDVHTDRGVLAGEVRGNLGADPIGLRARTGTAPDLDTTTALAGRVAGRYPKLRAVVVDALPYHEAGSSDGQELGCALATTVAYLRALTDAGLDVDTAVAQVELRLAATADQFATIAKFRAARRLVARVTEVCGARVRAVPQHAVTSSTMMTRRDPWVNMLRTTVACFAAGAGGADAVTVQPFDAAIGLPDAFARRIARNTQSILIEESKVAGVIDPAGGSWYVERHTDELARAGWAVFTEIERAGGILAALDNGLVDERLAATRTARTARFAAGEESITGVTVFPNPDEQPLVRQEAPPVPSGGLPRVRYAEPFEAKLEAEA
ncbi:methylmalonyl-CoA mutase subunit beta [Actinophytocola gossypii]|uniref:Methylmalonyl-CoA mutase subunit beta n=1 Tax=Actinophytocola gossypii TaxID=2812003 RepID=A0ABT2JE66_9PSEU|nr:methylmalonyl-CoA mutase subunit beta [Actinophytocola gossypii]MCT2586169.1 methylmalonyl-CoA mutase subunit beta [Actinophytocola gossypii]